MVGAFVFLTGFSMMAFEILAARLVAPFLGSSLYTWTAIIGSILLGIILGAPLGGWLSDKYRPVRVLGGLFLASGLVSLLAYTIAYALGPSFSASNLGMPILAFTFSVLVFFPPALLSGATMPAATRTLLDSLEHTGRVYGSLGSWNSAGSILGTYLTGFLFQAYFSTRLVWFTLALLLVLVGLIQSLRARRV